MSESLVFAINSDFVRAPETFHQRLRPRIEALTNAYEPSIESSITTYEQLLLKQIRLHGISSLMPFAIRGISTYGIHHIEMEQTEINRSRRSLADWQRDGYLSQGGGNFFVFHPNLRSESPEAFLTYLYASVYASVQYGMGDIHPMVLVVDLDAQFNIPASGGNDGIDGTFPTTISIDGTDYLFHNLDVGSITKPHVRRQNGLIAERVDPRKVRSVVGSEGIPAGLEIGSYPEDRWDYSDDKKVILSRWFYKELLKHIVIRNELTNCNTELL